MKRRSTKRARRVAARVAVAAMLPLLATCAIPAPKPPIVVASPPVIKPPTPPVTVAFAHPAGGWEDWAITPGDWAFDTALTGASGGASARYDGSTGTLMTLGCDRPRGMVVIAIAGLGATSDLAVRTTGGTEDFTGAGGSDGGLRISLQSDAGILDRMAFSRGRFALSNGAGQGMAFPAWSEIGRVVEFCRGG